MKIYLAPLENITTLIYRNAIHEMFGDFIDTYFMPFFMPHTKISLDEKDRRQLDPDRNMVDNLIPQILTDDSDGFWRMAKGIIDMGYKEININIGCPSNKVTSKGRGAGLLARKRELDRFLEGVFEKNTIDISVKTRIGMRSPEEFYELLDIYNKYPIKELIIHPRTGIEKYSGYPHREYFTYALEHSKNPVCYNGDIYRLEDYKDFIRDIELKIDNKDQVINRMTGVMLGRGLLANPALGREIKGGAAVSGEELLRFMNLYREKCREIPKLDVDSMLLNKSKEIWSFMKVLYPHRFEEIKSMLTCKNFREYLILEERFFKK